MQNIEPANRGLKFLLAGLFAVVLAITLSAGLWPFSFHAENQVRWQPEWQGLYFGDHGMVISKEKFNGLPDNSGGCSVAVWLEPALTSDSSTILSFYQPGASSRFQIRQSGDDLVVVSSTGVKPDREAEHRLFLDHVFKKGQPVQITVTYDRGTLNVYLGGNLKRSTKNVAMRNENFAGTMIVANTPYGDLSWTGTIRGLAIYDRALKPEEVKKDFAIERADRRLIADQGARPYSLYLFDEQQGTTLRDLGSNGVDLLIPDHYFIFQAGFLVPLWREFRPDWNYVKDLAINIFGLVPLGFCSAAIWAWLRGSRKCLLYVTVFGFCVSLTIEVLQAFIPTRFSGTTDLITNTTGTLLGGWMYLRSGSQAALRRLGLVKTG